LAAFSAVLSPAAGGGAVALWSAEAAGVVVADWSVVEVAGAAAVAVSVEALDAAVFWSPMFAPDGVAAAALWSAVPVELVALAEASGAVGAGAVALALADASGAVADGAVALAEAFMSVLLVDVEAVLLEVEAAPELSAVGAGLPVGTAAAVSAVMAAGVSLLFDVVLEAVELSDLLHLSAIICTLVTLKLSPLMEPVSWTSWPLCALRSLVLPVSL